MGINTGVHNVRGIELNSYAAELARVTVWIGEIQWMLRHGVPPSKDPILKPLDTIECKDALLAENGIGTCLAGRGRDNRESTILGAWRMNWAELGDSYTERLRTAYDGRLWG